MRMHRQGDLKKHLIFFPQLQQMLPTLPSLSVRWVCGWSQFSWDAGHFYLERCPAWLPLVFHGGNLTCNVCMSCLEAQQRCQVRLRLGLMVSQRNCLSGSSLLFAPKLSQKQGLAVPILYFCIADMLHISGRKPSLVVWMGLCASSCCARRLGTGCVEAVLQQPEQKTLPTSSICGDGNSNHIRLIKI